MKFAIRQNLPRAREESVNTASAKFVRGAAFKSLFLDRNR